MVNTLENGSRFQLSSIADGLCNKAGLLFKDAFSDAAINNALHLRVITLFDGLLIKVSDGAMASILS